MSREALEEAPTVLARLPSSRAPTPAPEESEPDATVAWPRIRPAAAGDVIADKYRLRRTLGRGGMGRVFEADHLLLGTKVALKFMHPHLARDRAHVARFSREARAAATLRSEHVTRIMDVDQLASGELYIVMEHLDGTSLETMAIDAGGLLVGDAVEYVVQACDALAEAHERGIIHRDVKPANLFLTKGKSGEPVIKVLDFGLAKSMVSTAGFSACTTATASGEVLGTPHYMSPEQVTGATLIDGRSDIWALGATLYELLTGQLAFPGGSAAMVFDRILRGRPTPLAVHRPDLPEGLVAVVERCLVLEPTGRFQTVRDLLQALKGSLSNGPLPFVAGPLSLDRFVRSAPPSIPPPPLDPALRGSAASAALSQPGVAPAPAVKRTRRTLLAVLVGLMVIAIAAGGVFLKLQPRATPGGGNEGVVRKVTYSSARSGGRTRAKAPHAEKVDRPRR